MAPLLVRSIMELVDFVPLAGKFAEPWFQVCYSIAKAFCKATVLKFVIYMIANYTEYLEKKDRRIIQNSSVEIYMES